MKIDKVKSFFQDEALCQALMNGKKKVKKQEIIDNLFHAARSKELIPLFLQRLPLIPKEKKAKKFFKLFKERLAKEKEVPNEITTLVEKVSKQFEKAIVIQPTKEIGNSEMKEEMKVQDKGKTAEDYFKKLSILPSFENSKFKDYSFSFEQLAKFGKDIKVLDQIGEAVEQECNYKELREVLAPSSRKFSAICPHSFPFDFNMAAKGQNVFLNASDIVMPDSRKYIFSACPMTQETVQNFFCMLISRKIPLVMSLHQVRETSPQAAFWSNDVLKSLKLPEGWTVAQTNKDIVATGKVISLPKKGEMPKLPLEQAETEKWLPRIVEYTITAKNGEVSLPITILHYENWHDHTQCPNLELLEAMLLRRRDLVPSNEPIFINCKAGRGRTFTVGLSDWCLGQVSDSLKQGKKAEDVRVNFPYGAFAMGMQRPSLTLDGKHFGQVCEVVSKFSNPDRAKILVSPKEHKIS
jgi:protein tyrosine phosphatase